MTKRLCCLLLALWGGIFLLSKPVSALPLRIIEKFS